MHEKEVEERASVPARGRAAPRTPKKFSALVDVAGA